MRRRRRKKHMQHDDNGGTPPAQPTFPATQYEWKKCTHSAASPVKIGGFDVWFGACNHIPKTTIEQMDVIVPLNGYMPSTTFGQFIQVFNAELKDRGGVPENWDKFLCKVIDLIKKGHKVVGYCTGGHGRTGTFGASLIAKMEPETEDPIEAFRQRHCKEAVESLAQAKAIFKLKGTAVPQKYEDEFKPKDYPNYSNYDWDSWHGAGNHVSGCQVYNTTTHQWESYKPETKAPPKALPPANTKTIGSKLNCNDYIVKTYSAVTKQLLVRDWGKIY